MDVLAQWTGYAVGNFVVHVRAISGPGHALLGGSVDLWFGYMRGRAGEASVYGTLVHIVPREKDKKMYE